MRTEKGLANLRPVRTKEEARLRGRNGGKKSGEVRGQLKDVREWMKNNLFKAYGANKEPLYEMLTKKLIQLSSQGNIKAIEMVLNYAGLKPIEYVAEVNTKGEDVVKNDLSKIDNETLLKMAKEAKLEIED